MMLKDNLHVIIPAAGIGSRSGLSIPKQYALLAGKPVIEHTLNCFINRPEINTIWVGLSSHDDYFKSLSCAQHPKIKTFIGGGERADTVLKGLQSARRSDQDLVLIHDAARPLLNDSQLNDLIESGAGSEYGSILANRCNDTLKHLVGTDVNTVPREQYWLAQTPQLFEAKTLLSALEFCQTNNYQVTDEASAVEQWGGSVRIVQSDSTNFKLTYPSDFVIAEALLCRGQ